MAASSSTSRPLQPGLAASTVVLLLAVTSTIVVPGSCRGRLVDATAARAIAMAVAVARDIVVTDHAPQAHPVTGSAVSVAVRRAGETGGPPAPPLLAERLLDLPPPMV